MNRVTMYNAPKQVAVSSLTPGHMFTYPDRENVFMVTDVNVECNKVKVISLHKGYTYNLKPGTLIKPFQAGERLEIMQGE